MEEFDEKIVRWIKALRSGRYKQTRLTLENQYGYCCLGVACKVLIPKNKLKLNQLGYIDGCLPSSQPNSPKWLNDISHNFKSLTNKSLFNLNDLHGFSFDEIADVLELVYIHKILD